MSEREITVTLADGSQQRVPVGTPAVEVLWNSVRPGLVLLAAAALFVNLPLPAVESSLNRVKLPYAPYTVLPALVKIPRPAVELLLNSV